MRTSRLLDCESVHGYVSRVCFKTGPPEHVGAELEWLMAPVDNPRLHVSIGHLEELLRHAEPFPAGSRITLEPGGQVELSSPVANSLTACWRALERDTDHLSHLLARHNLVVLPTAIDPGRPPLRRLTTQRYDAMDAYFAATGQHAGPVMMNSTAAVQVNVDAGADAADVVRRWQLLHAIGPVLVGTFANSPVHQRRRTGWKSTRQHVWARLDPARTAAPAASHVADDPAQAWAEYALDAPVMAVRAPSLPWQAAPGFTLRDWVTGAAGIEPPTVDDVEYHLTTLFPPVRPRGWFEVRYIDTQPGHLWAVPLAVVSGLVNDPIAADLALDACAPVATRWRDAARVGLDDATLATAAQACLEAALAALVRSGTDPALVALVEGFLTEYAGRGRCPADDQLETALPAGFAGVVR